MLIEYLLAHRMSDVSQETLINILWEDEEECGDPYHALKNLIYRARKTLKEVFGDERDYIRFTRGTYAWDRSLPCQVDAEEFERLWKEAAVKELDNDRKIDKYLQALDWYQGDFLPKSAAESWVISKSAYYASLYNECVLKVSSLLMDARRYHDVIAVTQKAVKLYPFEESIHQMLIFAYLNIGKQSKALAHYEFVIDLFRKEMNVDITESLRSLHSSIVDSQNAIETDLSVIKNDLKEACSNNGAFYCDYSIFKNIYRLLARSMMRTGQSIHIGLLTITDPNGDLPDENILKDAKDKLRECIIYSLRKGDAVTSYSAAQFVVILPLTTFENGERVLSRIVERYRILYGNKKVKISTRVNNMDPT